MVQLADLRSPHLGAGPQRRGQWTEALSGLFGGGAFAAGQIARRRGLLELMFAAPIFSVAAYQLWCSATASGSAALGPVDPWRRQAGQRILL